MPSDLRSDDHGPRGGPAADETRLLALEEKVTLLAARLDHMEQRLSGLSLPSLPETWPLSAATAHGASARTEMARWVTFLGRSCVVLGGAFLIRALTDGRILPGSLGVALGLLFAATWVYFAHRAEARGVKVSAGFHAVVATLIAYPLILESTTRLGAMSPAASALTLIAFTGSLLAVSWRDRLVWLAWIGVLVCLATTLVLLRATSAGPEFTAVLLVLAAATFFWLGDRWRALRWAPAVVLDLVILRAVLTSTPPVLLFAVALAGMSLGLALSRTTTGTRAVGAFEVFQTVAGLVIGLAGALRAFQEAGYGVGVVAGGVLATSLVTTFFASWVVPRRGNRDLDFLFYAALSLALVSAGVALLTGGDLRGVLWSALSLLAVLLGRRSHPVSLWSLAVLLALGAAFSSGLLSFIWEALAGREAIHWQGVRPGTVIVLGLVVLGYLATVPPLQSALSAPSSSASQRLPAAVLLLLGSAGVAALLLQGSHPLTVDLARLASARTVVAVGVALSLTLIRRQVPRPELTWITTLALGLGGVELALVELPSGRPLTLLVSFVIYGAGLILVTRLAPPGRDLPTSSRP
jgi:hypothetical protein